jgi:hypothetical protein
MNDRFSYSLGEDPPYLLTRYFYDDIAQVGFYRSTPNDYFAIWHWLGPDQGRQGWWVMAPEEKKKKEKRKKGNTDWIPVHVGPLPSFQVARAIVDSLLEEFKIDRQGNENAR